MTRILRKDINKFDNKTLKEKEEIGKKILINTLSHLSGFNQIFIDNLHGDPKFKIEQIIMMNYKELFKTLINTDEEFINSIYTYINYMQYNILAPYKNLSKENYKNKLIELISNRKELRDLINESIIKKSFEKNGDLIPIIFKDPKFIEEKHNDIEILSNIKRYLSIIYQKELSLMFFKLEKDQFFSTLLTYEIKNEDIIENFIRYYLENMVYKECENILIKKIGANKIDIIFGLKIPGIKPILDKFIFFVKENTLKDYRHNENELRHYIDEEEAKEKYLKNLSLLNNSLFNLINKEEDLKKNILQQRKKYMIY